MLNDFKRLVRDYIDAYWDIKNETEALTVEQRNAMQAELLKQFFRDCARLEGEDGLAAERERVEHENELKRIEEIKKLENAKIDAEYKLQHAKLQRESEINKALIEEEIQLQQEMQEKELEIRRRSELLMLEAKEERIVPVARHHRTRWLRRWRPNEAYVLMANKAQLEARKYLTDRRNELIELQAELYEAPLEEVEQVSATATEAPLVIEEKQNCEVSDEQGNAEITELPTDTAHTEVEYERLQNRAVALIMALCERRISELQQEQLKKPARKRVRKPDNTETENLSEGSNDK